MDMIPTHTIVADLRSPVASSFYKADEIPAGRKPVMLVGSNYTRLAVGYTEA